jgi:hypothetical protein
MYGLFNNTPGSSALKGKKNMKAVEVSVRGLI